MTNLNGPDAYGSNDPLARSATDPSVTAGTRDTTDVPMTRSDDVLNSGDPDAIREEIERTRNELSYDVDVLADKVNPSKIVQRRTDKVKSKLGSVKDKVMGAAHDAKHSTGDTASGVGDSVSSAASSVGSAVRSAPAKAVETAQGNPLAVGLIAFGVGWLAASLIPASSKERELATQAKEAAQPLAQAATEVAKEAAQNLREPAMEAVDAVKGTATEAVAEVKGTAQEGVETVKAEGQMAAGDVKDRAQEAKENVQNS
jgi:ElaB/YqjD/DUF883 family membrane-anchored ribosome-binding protein